MADPIPFDNPLSDPASLPGGFILDLPEHLFDLIPAAVYVCDADGCLVRFNRRAAALWGRHPNLGEPETRLCGARPPSHIIDRALAHADGPARSEEHTSELQSRVD